jgi:hypothetical protein
LNLTRPILVAALLFGMAGSMFGTLLTGCATCQGGTYDLTYVPITIGPSTDVFGITFKADLTGYTGVGLYVDSVAVKPSNSILDFLALSAPGGASGWTAGDGGLNANGCSGAGSGFLCSESFGLGAPIRAVYTWSYMITVSHGSLFTGPNEASIKALFTNATGTKVGAVLSEDISMSPPQTAPEPATFVLIGTALAGLGLIGQRRLKAKQ